MDLLNNKLLTLDELIKESSTNEEVTLDQSEILELERFLDSQQQHPHQDGEQPATTTSTSPQPTVEQLFTQLDETNNNSTTCLCKKCDENSNCCVLVCLKTIEKLKKLMQGRNTSPNQSSKVNNCNNPFSCCSNKCQ
jgi:hypothetical protein